MRYRTLGRLGWPVSEVGYGMWGIGGGPGGFTGWDYDVAPGCLELAVDLGCTFFDTAWVYGRGVSERLLGDLLRRRTERIDLLQFHVWEDRWSADESWQRTVAELKAEGVIGGFGLSVNRWEPANCLKAIDTGLVDAVQVIYNIFDQAPEDELFERAVADGIGIIARVPFDEGGLTGALARDTVFPAEDWRSVYFGPENLGPTVDRAERLAAVLPDGIGVPELALRFILRHPAVSTVIPGMRRPEHVRANLAVSERPPLGQSFVDELRRHRWDRTPTGWSM